MKNSSRLVRILICLGVPMAMTGAHAQHRVPSGESGSIPVSIVLAAADATPQGPTDIVVDLVVQKGRLISGANVVRVKKGDRIVMHVKSDASDEMHLHGYDLHLALTPGTVATLQFVADRTGRFTYELHKSDLELGALEVYPR
jgi:hypothetical protein